MGRSSLLGIERASPHAPGHDTDALGPSDSSDSGSDVQGLDRIDDGGPDAPLDRGAADDIARPGTSTEAVAPGVDSDAQASGERRSAVGDAGPDGADIGPDRIVGAVEVDDEAALDDLRASSPVDQGDEEEDEDAGPAA